MGAAGPEITAHSKIHYLLFSHKNEICSIFQNRDNKAGAGPSKLGPNSKPNPKALSTLATRRL